MRSHLLATILLLLAATPGFPEVWEFGPVPEGVLDGSDLDAKVASGVAVADEQVVENPESRVFFHRVSYRETSGGMRVGYLDVDAVDPRSQHVIIHWMRVLREGRVRDQRARIRTRQLETDLPRVSLSAEEIPLADGDVYDAAWSVVEATGSRIFGEADIPFASTGSWNRFRLVWLRPDSLRWSSGITPTNPEMHALPVGRSLTWENCVASGFGSLEWSDFGDWPEVGPWYAPWFQPSRRPGSATKEAVRRILGKGGERDDRILSALRVAQGIREDGTTVGGFRYRGLRPPRDPDVVLSSGVGDAADKANLLRELLGMSGVEAAVVVAPRWDAFLSRRIPRPSNLLDRFLVQVRLEGRSVLLDPMATFLPGGVAANQARDCSRFLSLDSAAANWGILPSGHIPAFPDLEVHVRIDASDFLREGKGSCSVHALGDIASGLREFPDGGSGVCGWFERLDAESVPDSGEFTGSNHLDLEGFWEDVGDNFWRTTLQVVPVANLVDGVNAQISSSGGFRLSPTHSRGLVEIRLPSGADEDSSFSEVSRSGLRSTLARSVRDDLLRISWTFVNPYLEVEGDSLASWKATLDSIGEISSVLELQDRRPRLQRLTDSLARANRAYAAFFLVAFLASIWAHRLVWRRNPVLREPRYGHEIPSVPTWWSLFPATLVLSGIWALWGLLEALPGVLGMTTGTPHSSFQETLVDFHACTARLFILPGLVLLHRLFVARRSSFRGLTSLFLILGSLVFLVEGAVRFDSERLDPVRVVAMAGLFSLWQGWAIYFSRSILATSVFRNQWKPTPTGDG